MMLDDILRASLKVLEEGEGRETNTTIGTMAGVVAPSLLLHAADVELEPSSVSGNHESLYPSFHEEDLTSAPSSTPSQVIVSLGGRRSVEETQQMSRLCKKMAIEINGPAVAIVFGLSSQKLRGIYIQDPQTKKSAATSIVELAGHFLELCLTHPMRPIFQAEAEGDDTPEEYFFFFNNTFCFVSLIPKRDTALILFTKEKSQQGLAWLSIRDTADEMMASR